MFRTFVVAALVLAPTAAAELTIRSIDAPPQPLVPDQEGVPITFHLEVDCSSLFVRGVPVLQSSFDIVFEEPEVGAPGVHLSGHRTGVIDGSPCLTDPLGAVAFVHEFEVFATVNAPGEMSIPVFFAASIDPPHAHDDASMAVPITIVVDYLGLLSAKSPARLKETEPGGTITYVIEIENYGNARTLVSMRGDVARDWTVGLPALFVLDSVHDGGPTVALVNVTLTPSSKGGWNNDEATLQVFIEGTSTKDANKTANTVQVNTLGRVHGMPGPAVALTMALMAAIVVLQRRPTR